MTLSPSLAFSFDEACAAFREYGDPDLLAADRPRLLAETTRLEPAFAILRDVGLAPHVLFVVFGSRPSGYSGTGLIKITDPLEQGGDEGRLYATLFGSAIEEKDSAGVLSYLAAEFTGHVPGMNSLMNDSLMAGVGELAWRERQDRHTVHDRDLDVGCRDSLTFRPPKRLFRAQEPPRTVRALYSYRQARPETVTYYERTWAQENDGLGAGAASRDTPPSSVRPAQPRRARITDSTRNSSDARVPVLGALHFPRL
ncbi:hypothetical protein AB0M64_10155 [Streptomyces sp. NPDC051771]|uniref:hypothetical protein n=1 Tax=Streptomyces sp. NPDC051771 TaxID=3154847 RepID=UPI00342F5FAE